MASHVSKKMSLKDIPKGTLKRIISYVISRHKIRFTLIVILVLASSLLGAYGLTIFGTIVDEAIKPFINGNVDYSILASKLVIMALVFLLATITSFLYNYLEIEISQKTLKDIRDDMFHHMESLPISYFDTNSHGDIMSRYTNDTDTLRQMISMSIPNIISSVATMLAVFIFMLKSSWLLTIFVIIFVIFMFFITKIVANKSGKYFIKHQESIGKLNGYIEEMINGTKVVKVFNHESKSIEDFKSINEDTCYYSTNAHLYANVFMPIMVQLGNLEYSLIAIIGGIMAINNTMGLTLGTVLAFLTLSKNFTSSISQVSNQLNSIIASLAGSKRIFELIDAPSEENNGKYILVNVKETKNGLVEVKENTEKWAWKKDNELVLLKGDVRFNNVNFGYTEDKTILHDINLYAKPGQKVAFVGATGAGKTTITNLINRFYDINSGSITYDGIDILDINKNYLRKSMGMVLQDVNLFTGTIYDNISYGNPTASKKEIIAAAKLANADNFIKMLPDGYDTVITENGSELSQGQKQLISIARAALVDPPVMILDEATSSIDTRTEKIVQDGMDKLMKGRTVFVIAHRLSTVRNSNVIVVLDNGKIIEKGNHEELINKKGRYYELYTGAFELE